MLMPHEMTSQPRARRSPSASIIELNPEIPKEKFDPPAEIKALVPEEISSLNS